MSHCTPGTCPHGKDVFVWTADGEWREDPADPNFGRFPWVHDTAVGPGHLEVCDLKPFATAGECGELCACGHSSAEHPSTGRPIPFGMLANPRPCPCGCPDFRHRPEDVARWREAGTLSGIRYRAGKTTPRPDDEDEMAARLSASESVPGGPGACAREGCGHLTLWHERKGKFRACRQCPCPAFTTEAGEVMPLVQGTLFGDPGQAGARSAGRAVKSLAATGGLL